MMPLLVSNLLMVHDFLVAKDVSDSSPQVASHSAPVEYAMQCFICVPIDD